MNKIEMFQLFGVFNSGDWSYAALLNRERTHFLPVMILPCHKFYLDLISHPDCPENACGPYVAMLDSWRSLGIKLESMHIAVRPDKNGRETNYGDLYLKMQNEIGTQIGIVQCDLSDAVVLNALQDIDLAVESKVMEPISVQLTSPTLTDSEILAEIEARMDSFKKESDAQKALMKELKDMPDNLS